MQLSYDLTRAQKELEEREVRHVRYFVHSIVQISLFVHAEPRARRAGSKRVGNGQEKGGNIGRNESLRLPLPLQGRRMSKEIHGARGPQATLRQEPQL